MCRAINNGVSFHSHPQITAKVHILVFSGASSNTWNISSMWCHSQPAPPLANHSNSPMWFLPLVPLWLLFPSHLAAFGQNLLVFKIAHNGSLSSSLCTHSLFEGSASVTPENLPEECFFIKGLILEIKLMHVVEYVFHHIDLLI